MTAVCVLQILANPTLDVGDLREGIARRLLACVELREANTKADLIHIRIWDQVIGCGRYRWVDEKLKQSRCGQTPTLRVTVNECLRLAKGLGKRNDRGLAIGGPCQLLGVRENDLEIDGLEDTAQRSADICIELGRRTYSC